MPSVLPALSHNIVAICCLFCLTGLVLAGKLDAFVVLPILITAGGWSTIAATTTTINVNHKVQADAAAAVTQAQTADVPPSTAPSS